jgi:hypothetical protein
LTPDLAEVYVELIGARQAQAGLRKRRTTGEWSRGYNLEYANGPAIGAAAEES